MAGLEADTSSFNQPLPVGPLEQARSIAATRSAVQGNISNELSIQKQKMEQADLGLKFMTRAMGSLGPNATKEQYLAVAQNAVKQGLVPADQLGVYQERLNAAKTSGDFYNEFMTAAKDHSDVVTWYHGQPGTSDNGQQVTPVSVSPRFGVRPTNAPIQKQIPPDANVATPGGMQMQGPTAPQLPVGAAPVPGAVPGSFRPASAPAPTVALPVAPPRTTGPTGPTTELTPDIPTDFNNRFAAAKPSGPMTSQAPMFEEGKKALTDDQALAAGKMQAVKPAIQAIKLMKTTYGDNKSLATGPGTEQFTNLVALAKAWGITDTKAMDDPTVMRQELEKKLAQYVGSNPVGQRSDAAQTLAEAGSPNPKKQILPALLKLTQDAVVLDRVQAARALSFKDQDLSKYGEHRAKFPQSIDERAFGLDLMDKDESKRLVDSMHNRYKKNPTDKEALKFFRSLDLAKSQFDIE